MTIGGVPPQFSQRGLIYRFITMRINWLSWRPGLVLASADNTKVWSGVPQLREGCWQLGQDLVSSKLTFVPLKLRENIRRLNPGCTIMETGFQRIWEQSKKSKLWPRWDDISQRYPQIEFCGWQHHELSSQWGTAFQLAMKQGYHPLFSRSKTIWVGKGNSLFRILVNQTNL